MSHRAVGQVCNVNDAVVHVKRVFEQECTQSRFR